MTTSDGMPRWLIAEGDRDLAGLAVSQLERNGYWTRLLQGEQLLTTPALLDHFAAALQFPWYFGRNWHAFDECFGELDQRSVGSGVALVIMNGESSLHTSGSTLEDLVTSLGYAASSWAEAPSGPDLVVVAQIPTEFVDHVVARWQQAGATFGPYRSVLE
jgi:hypothetical protein